MANDPCSWLKRCLWRFTGMSPRNLQTHLYLYVYLFRIHQTPEMGPDRKGGVPYPSG